MFIVLLQTARCVLKSVICTAHFADSFNSVFNKKNENFSGLCSITCKKKKNRLNT